MTAIINPRERLAVALEIAAAKTKGGLGQIAVDAKVSSYQIANAVQARPVASVEYLRLCAVIGLDPLPEIPHEMVKPAKFDAGFFALALRMRRRLNKHSTRHAGHLVGVQAATISRAEAGDELSIGVLLKLCLYVRQHPFAFFPVSRETKQTNDVNTSSQVGAAA